MRFSRHAKNEMRLYGISRADVAIAVLRAFAEDVDERGNLRFTAADPSGRAIMVVIAVDDPDFVITTFPVADAS